MGEVIQLRVPTPEPDGRSSEASRPAVREHYPIMDLSFVGEVPLYTHPWQPNITHRTTHCWMVDLGGIDDAKAWRTGCKMALEAMRYMAGRRSRCFLMEEVVQGMVLNPGLDSANAMVRSAFLNTFGELAHLCAPVLHQFDAAVSSSNYVARRRFEAMMQAARDAGPKPRRRSADYVSTERGA